MKKTASITLLTLALLLSACATPGAIEQDSKVAWEGTKEVSSEAWDGTKKVSGEVWEGTKQASGQAWESTKSAVNTNSN